MAEASETGSWLHMYRQADPDQKKLLRDLFVDGIHTRAALIKQMREEFSGEPRTMELINIESTLVNSLLKVKQGLGEPVPDRRPRRHHMRLRKGSPLPTQEEARVVTRAGYTIYRI